MARKKIVVVAADMKNGGILGVVNGIQEAATAVGWSVTVLDSAGPSYEGRELVQMIQEQLLRLGCMQGERSGAFVQNDFQWTSDLKLSLGARYDWMSHQAGQLSPRLGAVYRSSAQTVWKVQYGSSFRAPNSYESNYGFPGTQRANPDLRPETIKTWEGGVEHYLDSQTRLLATAYMYRLDKLIDQISESQTGPLQYVNSGKTRAHGIELEAERLWRNGVRLRTSLDLQHAHDNRGNDLSNSPRTSAKMNLSVPLPWMSLRLGTEGQWLAGRRTDSGRVPSYGIANLTLLRPMAGDGWEWSSAEEYPGYLKWTTVAYQMMINEIVYTLTH